MFLLLHPNMYLSYHIISEKSAFFSEILLFQPFVWYNKNKYTLLFAGQEHH